MVKDVGCTHSLGPDFNSARETQGGLATKDTGANFWGGRNGNNGYNLGAFADIVAAKECITETDDLVPKADLEAEVGIRFLKCVVKGP